MIWVDYDGQDVTGYDAIGTDEVKYPIQEGMDVQATVDELVRRCGRSASIKLYKEVEEAAYETG